MNRIENDNKSGFDAWFQKYMVLIIGIVLLLAMVASMFMMLTIIKKITILQSMNQYRPMLNGCAKFIEHNYTIPLPM